MSNNGFKSVLAFEQAVDRRLPTHYSSYHIGRLLLITGSVTLLSGLLLKFIFYEDRVGPIFIVTLIICGLGVALFLLGAALIILAARKSTQAQDEFAKQAGLNQPSNYQHNLSNGYSTNNNNISTDSNHNNINANNNNIGNSFANNVGNTTRVNIPLGRSISQTLDNNISNMINLQSATLPSTLERVDPNLPRH